MTLVVVGLYLTASLLTARWLLGDELPAEGRVLGVAAVMAALWPVTLLVAAVAAVGPEAVRLVRGKVAR